MSQAVFSASPLGDYISRLTKLNRVREWVYLRLRKGVTSIVCIRKCNIVCSTEIVMQSVCSQVCVMDSVKFRQYSKEVFKDSTWAVEVISQWSIVWLRECNCECKLWVPSFAVSVERVSSWRWRLLDIDGVDCCVQRLLNMWNSDSAIWMSVIKRYCNWAANKIQSSNPEPTIISDGTRTRHNNNNKKTHLFYLIPPSITNVSNDESFDASKHRASNTFFIVCISLCITIWLLYGTITQPSTQQICNKSILLY
jgi:hypothetical protein